MFKTTYVVVDVVTDVDGIVLVVHEVDKASGVLSQEVEVNVLVVDIVVVIGSRVTN